MKIQGRRPMREAGSRGRGVNALLAMTLVVAVGLAGTATAGGNGLGLSMGKHPDAPLTPGEQRCFNNYIANGAKCVSTFCHSFLFFGWCEHPEFSECVNNAQQVFDECMDKVKNGGSAT